MAKPGRRSHIDRRYQLNKRYGLTPERYQEILNEQGGVCAICFYKPSSKEKRLCIDHSHEDHSIRGLLCQYCNIGLGRFKDSHILLSRAIKYLTKRKNYGIIKTRGK